MGGQTVKLFGWIFGILFIVSLMFVLLTGGQSRRRIAIVDIEGQIVAGENGSSIFGNVVAGSETIMSQIRKAAADRSIKGLILQINSPGGSSPASEAIYREVLRFREQTGKPVLAVMGDVAASGGFYIAVGADEIYANPATITGSIGVIMQFANYEDLYQKYGVEMTTIKSGKYKDIGDSARDLTREEHEMLQLIVNQIYQRFVRAVMSGRKLSEERVLELAQGQIYTGIQAKKLGLIDYLGNFYDAVNYFSNKINVKGKPLLVYYTETSLIKKIISSFSSKIFTGVEKPLTTSQWTDLLFIEKSQYEPGVKNIKLIY